MADAKVRFARIIEKLRANNYKVTPQRLAVARILAKEGHPSVDEICKQLLVDFPTMSVTTVYRNIILMKSLGEVLELGFPDGSNRYDGNKPHPHPHIICVRCKRILDPDLASLRDMTQEVAAETGFEIITHRLDFFGVCPDCRSRNAED